MTTTLIDDLKGRISTAISVNHSTGILLHGNNYNDLIQALISYMSCKDDAYWVYVAVTRPYDTIVQNYNYIQDKPNITFIDCISRAAGISGKYSKCKYIESPVVLEKILLEIMNSFNNVPEGHEKYLIIDTLSSLLLYNDVTLVTEFLTHLTNRSRLYDIHNVSIVIEEETDDNINKMIYLRSEKIIKLKESFI